MQEDGNYKARRIVLSSLNSDKKQDVSDHQIGANIGEDFGRLQRSSISLK